MRRLKNFICVSVALLWFGGVWMASAEEMAEKKEDERTIVATVTGTVSTVGGNFINVEYSKNKGSAKEMFLPLSDKVRLDNFQSLKDLKYRDAVRVRYEQTYKEDEDGKRVVLKTVATEITRVEKPRDPGLRSVEGQGH